MLYFQITDVDGGNPAYCFGVDINVSMRAIADCVSAGFSVPLGTDAILSPDKQTLTVGRWSFKRTSRPNVRCDLFYPLTSAASAISNGACLKDFL